MKLRTWPYCGALLAMLLTNCTTLYSHKKHRHYSFTDHREIHSLNLSSDLLKTTPFFQKGLASWYGRRFHGRRTANGERYNMYALTAAHRTLPMSSYVRVTNIANGRSIVVRINDRGPFIRRRVIDLSYAAAQAIGLHQRGIGLVEIQGLQQL